LQDLVIANNTDTTATLSQSDGTLGVAASLPPIGTDVMSVSLSARERIVSRFREDALEYEIISGGDEYVLAVVNVIELL
jgi:hypothetical protein